MQFVLDKYLSKVEGHLRSLPPNVRQGEIDEMASHLQQLRADFLSRGHTVEEAEALATARFGTARQAGLRLRDVWEGNRGALASFAAVAASNWVLQFGNLAVGLWFIFAVAIGNRALIEPLSPLLWFWVLWALLLLPFGLNFALGRWGGRRVALSTLATHLPLLALHSNFSGFTIASLSFPYLLLLLTVVAFAGAWSGSACRRRRRFALVGGASLEIASALLSRRGNARRILLWLGVSGVVLGLAGAIAFAVFKARINDVLRPPTPEAAVRVMLRSCFGSRSAARAQCSFDCTNLLSRRTSTRSGTCSGLLTRRFVDFQNSF